MVDIVNRNWYTRIIKSGGNPAKEDKKMVKVEFAGRFWNSEWEIYQVVEDKYNKNLLHKLICLGKFNGEKYEAFFVENASGTGDHSAAFDARPVYKQEIDADGEIISSAELIGLEF